MPLSYLPPMVIGQFHTLFFGSVYMLFLGTWGFAVHGNEVNLFCYQFRPITLQIILFFFTFYLFIYLFVSPFHLHAACKSIKQGDIYQKSFYTGFCIFSAFSRIIHEAVCVYLHDVGALEKKFNITQYVGPKHFAKTIFLIAMYTFTVITVVFVAKIFEISCKRLGFSRTL
uniref:Uncharacterized protein n=1 Tax=Melopsittacus undulatus TaxID=13146 RepID=A0A8V5FU05_MELUD